MTLPSEPGLLRRLAYGRCVYYRNRRRNLIAVGNNITNI